MKIKLIIPFLAIFLFYSCELSCFSDPGVPIDQSLPNPVFPNSLLITVNSPVMNDITTSSPDFSWISTGESLVFLGVFKENISITNGSISNPDAIVWVWHSGMNTGGREGSILFSNGRDMIDGEIIINQSPTPLESSRAYIWAVWSWDKDTLEINRSSKEMYFEVEP